MGLMSSIFGPSRGEIWSQIARDIGGNYEEGGWFSAGVLWYEVDN
jgi:hypothetical protein